jgi:hypothetical protein
MRDHLQEAIIHLMYDTPDSVSLKDAIHMVNNNYVFNAPYPAIDGVYHPDDIIDCIEDLRPYILFTHPYRTLNGTLMDGKLYPTPMFKAQVREWFDGKVSLTYGAQSLNRVLTDLYGSYYERPILDIVEA